MVAVGVTGAGWYSYSKRKEHPISTTTMPRPTATSTSITSTATPIETSYKDLKILFPESREFLVADVEYAYLLDENSNHIPGSRLLYDERIDKESKLGEIPDKAHLIKLKASSCPEKPNLPFKEVISKSTRMDVYLNGNRTDSIKIYPRKQIHYIRLRPDRDSDRDGILGKDVDETTPLTRVL